MKNKSTWLNRGLSLLLVFIMVFAMLPTTVFAGGSDATTVKGVRHVKNEGFDATASGTGNVFNAFALRFSLYFFEGAEKAADLETGNYTQVIPLGNPINIKYYEHAAGRLKGKYTNNSVYDYMGERIVNGKPTVNQNFENWTYSKYLENVEIGTLPMVSVTNEYGENITDIFPQMFTFYDAKDPHSSDKTFNEFLQGVDDITKFIDSGTKKFKTNEVKEFFLTPDAEGYKALGNTIAIMNKIAEPNGYHIERENLVYGTLKLRDNIEHKGIIQMYIEPVIPYYINRQYYLFTFREALAFYKSAEAQQKFDAIYADTYNNISAKVLASVEVQDKETKKWIPKSVAYTTNDKSISGIFRLQDNNGKDLHWGYTTVNNVTWGRAEYSSKMFDPEMGYYFRYKYINFSNGSCTIKRDKSEPTTYASFFTNGFKRLGNTMYLENMDHPAIRMLSAKKANYNSSNLNSFSLNDPVAKNSLGVGVFTSFNTYGEVIPTTQDLKIVTSYVTTDGNGNFTEFKPSTIRTASSTDFRTLADGTVTEILKVPVDVNASEGSKENFELSDLTFNLNDVVGTYEFLKETDGSKIKWENSDMPKINGSELKESAVTQSGLNLITGSKNITKSNVKDVSFMAGGHPYALSGFTSDATEKVKTLKNANVYRDEFGKTFTSVSGANFFNKNYTSILKNIAYVDNYWGVVYFKSRESGIEGVATLGYLTNLKDDEGNEIKDQHSAVIDEKEFTDEESKALSRKLWEDYKTQNNILDTDTTAQLPTNTIYLRYVVVPSPTQYNIVEKRKEDGTLISRTPVISNPLEVDDENTATIQRPNGFEDNPDLEIVNYTSTTGTSIDYPDFESKGTLPSGSPSGNTENAIPNYPANQNLFVIWKIVVPANDSHLYSVPEWRLSKLFAEDSVVGGTAMMTLPITYGHCDLARLYDSGNWNYTTRNPNGLVTLPGHLPTNLKLLNWVHAETVKTLSTDTVGPYKKTASVFVDGRFNAIKSTDTSNLKVANWLNGSSLNDLLKYDIQNGNMGTPFDKSQYRKGAILNFDTLNLDTYRNTWPKAHWHKKGHCHWWTNSKNITPLEATYTPYAYPISVTFDRYNQDDTDSRKLTVSPEIKSDNGFTTIKYQLEDELKIYPEYGMLFADDAGNDTIKWAIGDEARVLSPVVWQTLEHKVYVTPKSTGTSVANDSRALAASNKLVGVDNTAKGKQMIYKGAAVNTAFQVNKDNSTTNKSKGILTFKTFALDFNDANTNLKTAWGNGSYSSYKQHSVILEYLKKSENNKANSTEKLLVDSPAYGGNDYVGGIRSQKTGSYNLIKYPNNANKVTTALANVHENGEAVVFNHKLIIRGGAVIGVVRDTRAGSKEIVTMEQLKTKDISLYNAIVGMNLYSEDGDRSKTILSTFEHLKGKALTEGSYATKLANARKTIDTIDTPASSAVSLNKGWYSEDTTVLVIKEYVSNFEVPSISYSDKISMSVKGLETPIDKTKFFNTVGKGYTYLKYDLPIVSPYTYSDGSKVSETSAYFEFSSAPYDNLGLGIQGVDYIVPNVTVSDTTRLN